MLELPLNKLLGLLTHSKSYTRDTYGLYYWVSNALILTINVKPKSGDHYLNLINLHTLKVIDSIYISNSYCEFHEVFLDALDVLKVCITNIEDYHSKFIYVSIHSKHSNNTFRFDTFRLKLLYSIDCK